MRRAVASTTAASVATALLLLGCGSAERSTSAPVIPRSPTPASTTASTPATRPTPEPPRTPTLAPTSRTPSISRLPAWLSDGVVSRLPTSRHVVALTFDGGAGAQGAASVLATLAAERVPATFFLTGQFVHAYPAVVTAIAKNGYVVGNHTMTHPHLPSLSASAVEGQITGARLRIEAATGHSPRPWFRFPYGDSDARTLGLVHQLGYGAIGWSVDTLGWEGRSGGTVDDIVARVRAALRPGAIVLMHLGANPDDGTTYDATALPAVIAAVRAAGYGFMTLADASLPQG